MKITLSGVCSIYVESILAATLCKCHEYCIYQNASEVVSITDWNMSDVYKSVLLREYFARFHWSMVEVTKACNSP